MQSVSGVNHTYTPLRPNDESNDDIGALLKGLNIEDRSNRNFDDGMSLNTMDYLNKK